MAFSFTFGGNRLETYGLIVFNVTRSMLPPSNIRSVVIPDYAGSYFIKADYEALEITVEVGINQETNELLASTTRTIAGYLNPSIGLQALIFDDETTLKYLAIITGSTSLDQVIKLRRGTITFLVPIPFAINVNPYVGSITTTLPNTGTAPGLPILTATFTGAASEYRITKTSTAEYISVVDSFVLNDVLVIDFSLRTITKNGVNAMAKLSLTSDFFVCTPGSMPVVIVGAPTVITIYTRFI